MYIKYQVAHKGTNLKVKSYIHYIVFFSSFIPSRRAGNNLSKNCLYYLSAAKVIKIIL